MVKKSSHSYLYDKEYIKHLIKQIENGSYDVELLTDYEREMIEDYLKNQNT
jgi:anti-sigma28 factor (negative regulator of flagellin synthesis)